MDKLTMAHDWAMKYGSPENFKLTVDEAWEYADRMQAEADKRKPTGAPEAIREAHKRIKDKIDLGEPVEIPKEYKRCKQVEVSEWQPVWSAAPDGFDWFAIDGVGPFWYRNMPTWDGEEWLDYKDDREGSSTEPTMPFGYKGKYIDSLRKRPEGK